MGHGIAVSPNANHAGIERRDTIPRERHDLAPPSRRHDELANARVHVLEPSRQVRDATQSFSGLLVDHGPAEERAEEHEGAAVGNVLFRRRHGVASSTRIDDLLTSRDETPGRGRSESRCPEIENTGL